MPKNLIKQKATDPDSLAEQAKEARAIGIPEQASGVVDAYYAVSPNPHSHHLEDATGQVECAAASIGESVRQKYQEDDDHDEVISNKK